MGRSSTARKPINTGILGYIGVANVTHLCNQCSMRYYGREFDDLHLTQEDPFGDHFHYCYGCGWTLVDIEGNCLLGHHMKQGTSEYKEQWQDTLTRFFGDAAVIEEDMIIEVVETEYVGTGENTNTLGGDE